MLDNKYAYKYENPYNRPLYTMQCFIKFTVTLEMVDKVNIDNKAV